MLTIIPVMVHLHAAHLSRQRVRSVMHTLDADGDFLANEVEMRIVVCNFLIPKQ